MVVFSSRAMVMVGQVTGHRRDLVMTVLPPMRSKLSRAHPDRRGRVTLGPDSLRLIDRRPGPEGSGSGRMLSCSRVRAAQYRFSPGLSCFRASLVSDGDSAPGRSGTTPG